MQCNMRVTIRQMCFKLFNKRQLLFRGMCYCGVPAYSVNIQGETIPKSLETPDIETLTHGYLIRNATLAAIDSTTALLNQTSDRLLLLEAEYTEALRELIRLMEAHVKALGNENLETHVWDRILAARYEVNNIKIQKDEMTVLYSCAVRMIESAAEAAHAAGASYAGMAANERLYSTRSHMTRAQDQSLTLEQALRNMEVKSIEEAAKQANKQKEKWLKESMAEDDNSAGENSENETQNEQNESENFEHWKNESAEK